MTQSNHGPFMTTGPLILASGSPRRQELLKDIGLSFTVHPSTLAEPAPTPNEDPISYASRMAELKTCDVAARYDGSTVLGADTIVVLGSKIMGKPTSATDALNMLSMLSGQIHQVITGFCIVQSDGLITTQAVSTDVTMRTSGETELKSYIATGEPNDKAGAYAIQGIGTFLVTGINGSYTNVVGLPVAKVLDALLSLNIVAPRQDR